jgi:hypothetical protein
MPRRTVTRADARRRRIDDERLRNATGSENPATDDDPPF